MKKFVFIVLALLVGVAYISCKADEEEQQEQQEGEKSITLATPQANASFDLSEVDKVSFNWTSQGAIESGSYKWLLSDNANLSGAVERMVNKKIPFEVSATQLEQIMTGFGIPQEETPQEHTFYWTITAGSVKASPRAITLKKSPQPPSPDIALTAPANGAEFDLQTATGVTFEWAVEPTGAITAVKLALSTAADFTAATFVQVSGSSYIMTSSGLEAILAGKGVAMGETLDLYWTVQPANPGIVASTHTRAITVKRASYYNLYNLLTDSKYGSGFMVGRIPGGTEGIHGYLNYGGTATGTPVWKFCQWNCYNNDIMNAAYTINGTVHTYTTNGGDRLVVDTQSGSVILGLNTESEYGKNGHTTNPRKEEEPWPTLLLEYACSENQLLNISNQREIRMAVEYELLKVEDKIPLGKTNTNIHTAQFQWYITVQNRNHSSPDYGRYIWFGLCFYDKRYDFTHLYASEDKGPNNTGAFIYVPAMKDIMGAQGKTEVGKTMVVDVDILPIIQTAFTAAQQRGYFFDTTWEELYIGGTNIGWEITGTYNAEVRIESFNIKYSN